MYARTYTYRLIQKLGPYIFVANPFVLDEKFGVDNFYAASCTKMFA